MDNAYECRQNVINEKLHLAKQRLNIISNRNCAKQQNVQHSDRRTRVIGFHTFGNPNVITDRVRYGASQVSIQLYELLPVIKVSQIA